MNLTPAMQQYYDIKEKYNDSILFFRMGDFYEMFDEDAHIAHRVLWINITTRNKNAINPTPLAGIPYHAKEKYLPILVNAWYKVAIVEQISDPKLKWIVKREVVRIVTPATLNLEWENYENTINNSNFIVSIVEKDKKYGLSYIELWENKWQTWEFIDFNSLRWELYKLSPKEVILEKILFNNSEIKEILSKKYSLNIYCFEWVKNPEKNLIKHFKVKNLLGFWLQDKELSICASSLLLEYLKNNQKSDLSFLSSISYLTFWDKLELDESTIRNLDLIYNFYTKSSSVWTLFWVLNNTKTSAWSRFLRNEIIKPLKDKKEIEKRQKFVWEFLNNKILLDKIQNELKMVSDIDTILNRLALNRAMPRDLLNLKRSLISIIDIMDIIEKKWSKELQEIIN